MLQLLPFIKIEIVLYSSYEAQCLFKKFKVNFNLVVSDVYFRSLIFNSLFVTAFISWKAFYILFSTFNVMGFLETYNLSEGQFYFVNVRLQSFVILKSFFISNVICSTFWPYLEVLFIILSWTLAPCISHWVLCKYPEFRPDLHLFWNYVIYEILSA